MSLASTEIRSEFPALGQTVNGRSLIYLDSAATSLKPKRVIETLHNFYSFETANVHRGAHYLSAKATEKYEACREKIKNFINAASSDEIIFTRGTTEALNLLATSFSKTLFKQGDEIILTEMEHHSNIVPWQALAADLGLVIRWVPVLENGELDFSVYEKIVGEKTKLVSLVHCSNSIGTVNPIEKYISRAKKQGALVVVDAAQSVLFKKLDVQRLNCDFIVFSGHKLYGPYGIGVLYGKKAILNEMTPYQYGGAMISTVSTEQSTYLQAPQRFEAGTPNISGVIGLSTAIDFMNSIGQDAIEQHEQSLTNQLLQQLNDIEKLKTMGHSKSRVNLLSFTVEGQHASDLGTLLDQQGIAVRVGHHCTMPLLKKFKQSSTVRVSFGVYNNLNDVDIFVQALKKSLEMLK